MSTDDEAASVNPLDLTSDERAHPPWRLLEKRGDDDALRLSQPGDRNPLSRAQGLAQRISRGHAHPLPKYVHDPAACVDRFDGPDHGMPYLDRAGDEPIGLQLRLHRHDLAHTQVPAGGWTLVERNALVLPVIDLDPVHPDAAEGADRADDPRASDPAPVPRRLVSGPADPRAAVVHRVAGSPEPSTRIGVTGGGSRGDEGEEKSQEETFDHGSALFGGDSGSSGAA